MAVHQPSDVSFRLTLEGEQIELADIAATLRDVERLLKEIEKNVRNVSRSSVRWAWGDESSRLELVAHVNGATADELTRIVSEAQHGFEQAERAVADPRGRVEWPSTFDSEAQRRARNILERLERLEAITIQAASLPEIKIEAAQVGGVVRARITTYRQVRSSVDGRLDLLSDRSGRLRATITEHNTSAVVRCSFDDSMIDSVVALFRQRVVAEGLVRYREDGSPISITDITDVRRRSSGRPLEDFVGASPRLASGLSAEDFLATVHGDE